MSFDVLYSNNDGIGFLPHGGMVLLDNMFYGVCTEGGNYAKGSIYFIDIHGNNLTLVYSFNVASGNFPYSGLVTDGIKLYGTTTLGGEFENGTIYSIFPDGTNFTVLHSFEDVNSNSIYSLLLIGTKLYGTTESNGEYSYGTIYSIDTDGNNYSVLHSFNGTTDGGIPKSSLITDGTSIYGTTFGSDPSVNGTIFSLSLAENIFEILYTFNKIGGFYANGKFPNGSLVLDGTDIYGMTRFGGEFENGVIFKITTSGDDYSVLHNFDGTDNSFINSEIILEDSLIYGVTAKISEINSTGMIFSINKNGSSFAILHRFYSNDVTNGSYPSGKIFLISSKLYGITNYGGDYDYGSMYKININGTGFDITHSFHGGDGKICYYEPTIVGSKLYGTTLIGGKYNFGAIYSFDIDNNNYSLIHSFDGIDGYQPQSTLTYDGENTLYGTTGLGGEYDSGIIYSISLNGNNFSKLYSFTSENGARPLGQLILNDSLLYGVTTRGGDYLDGIIFSFSILDNTFTKMHSFGNTTDGKVPCSNLLFDSENSILYGTTETGGQYDNGTIFSISINPLAAYRYRTYRKSGELRAPAPPPVDVYMMAQIYSFDTESGYTPANGLIMNGNILYGATKRGGANSLGTIYSIEKNGTNYSILHSFSEEFGHTSSDFVLVDSYLYGVCIGGGDNGYGNIYKFSLLHNTFTSLYSFSEPLYICSKIINIDSKLYSSSGMGGLYGLGQLFSYDISSGNEIVISSPTEISEIILFQRDKKSFELIKDNFEDHKRITITWMSNGSIIILPMYYE